MQRVCPSPVANSCECPAYIQGNAAAPGNPSVSVTVAYSTEQAAGDLNIVAVGWKDSTSQVQSVTDSVGNTYVPAAPPTLYPGIATQALYYAKNISGTTSNTVTVTFNAAVDSPNIRVAEYSGIDVDNPIDVAVGAAGDGASASSGSVTTNNPYDLLVSASYVETETTGPGESFTGHLAAGSYEDVLDDRVVSTAGPYSASVPMSASGFFVTQLVALRLAGGGGNKQGLSAPTNLTAAASGGQINLNWAASTDNSGVTGYLVERCTGSSCSDFVQIAKVPGIGYSDGGPLAASSSYTYRVRATDVANLLSAYSGYATATTGP